MEELKEISKPLIEYLKKNYNPHTAVIISENCVKVISDEISIPKV